MLYRFSAMLRRYLKQDGHVTPAGAARDPGAGDRAVAGVSGRAAEARYQRLRDAAPLEIWQAMRMAPGVDTLPEEKIHRLA